MTSAPPCATGRWRFWGRSSRCPAGGLRPRQRAVKDFLAYLEVLVARRRANPGNPDRDVLTRLIQGENMASG